MIALRRQWRKSLGTFLNHRDFGFRRECISHRSCAKHFLEPCACTVSPLGFFPVQYSLCLQCHAEEFPRNAIFAIILTGKIEFLRHSFPATDPAAIANFRQQSGNFHRIRFAFRLCFICQSKIFLECLQ